MEVNGDFLIKEIGVSLPGRIPVIEEIKKDSVPQNLCLKTHELDAEKIDNLTNLIGRVEEGYKTDQKQTRATLRELAHTVDDLKGTVLEVGHLRRRGDRSEG